MPSSSLLTHITLTGVDDHTDIAAVATLSHRYSLVEWGFLYSPKRQGNGGRYPSIDTLRKAFKTLPSNVRVALHVCGSGVPNLLAGEPVVTELVVAVARRSGRVQLNFSQSSDNLDLDALSDLLDRFHGMDFIIQHNEANQSVWAKLFSHGNCLALFDSSGGRGIECGAWPAPMKGFNCGYAGGLGPDNLDVEMPRIRAAAHGTVFWIDMEGKLRTQDDVFDLARAESCLRKATTAVLSAMNPDEARAAIRFCETCDDGEGYDVPRPMMKRLEELGLVVDKKFGRFEQTLLLLDIRETLDAEVGKLDWLINKEAEFRMMSRTPIPSR